MPRFAFYCACGASFKGAAPVSSPAAIKVLWQAVHPGDGPDCGPTTARKCGVARRRADARAAEIGEDTPESEKPPISSLLRQSKNRQEF